MLPLFIAMPNGTELIIIALVVLVLFGGRKIPEFMRGLGKGVKSFKDGVSNIKDELDDASQEDKRDDKKGDKKS